MIWCPWELQNRGRPWKDSEFEAGDSRDTKSPAKLPGHSAFPPLLVPPLSPTPCHTHPNWIWVPSLIPRFLDPSPSALMFLSNLPPTAPFS